MKVKVELQAYLQEYSPDGQPAFDYELPEGSRVRDLVAKLRIPDEMAAVIVLNGRSGDYEDPVQEGDTVTLVPPLAGG
jgi:molybdopterin converting factor small subunit